MMKTDFNIYVTYFIRLFSSEMATVSFKDLHTQYQMDLLNDQNENILNNISATIT